MQTQVLLLLSFACLCAGNMCVLCPVGKYKLNVCTNLPCQLRNGQVALEHLCAKLGVADGGTSADGLFTVAKC